jgi:hypothetical protein
VLRRKHRLVLHILVLQNQELAELVRVDIQSHRQPVFLELVAGAGNLLLRLHERGDWLLLLGLLIVVIN